MNVRGFHGEVSDVRVTEDRPPLDLLPFATPGAEIDLVAMARWGLRALRKNPRPHLGCECRFHMNLLKHPPCPGPDDHDPITAGDTENRMDWAFGYLKEMCGDASADEIAAGVRRRILGRLRGDGLCWVEASSFSSLPGIWANHWTTGKLLISLCEDYRRAPDETLRQPCRKMFEALRDRANWADGRAYYSGGNSCWDGRGWAVTDASPYHAAMPLEAVVRFYEAFGDQEALDFAVALAEGEMANDQWGNWILRDPGRLTPEQKEQVGLTSSVALWPTAPPEADLSVRQDGSFDHHSHMRGHQGWGMAHLAAITREPRLVGWSRRLLDAFLSRGTDYGWIPESMTYPRRSETCAVADVINIAEWVAGCGYPEYWDVVERFVRNYIREAQFFCSSDYEEVYRSRHPGEEGERGLDMARDLQGGFQGAMGLCDRVWNGADMDMMGCCVPEGMRSIYTAWNNVVARGTDGVRVNMSFDRDAPEAEVRSMLPHGGCVTVLARVSDHFWLRPPAWAPRDRVQLRRQGQPVPKVWRDGFLFVDDVQVGETLGLVYPLISLTQRQNIRSAPGEPDRHITVSWLGNTVVDLNPKGDVLPLYQDVPRPLPRMPSD